MQRKFNLRMAGCALALLLCLVGGSGAQAANFVVSDCGDNGGPNQLRAKLNEVKATGESGNITFSCGPSITLLQGEITINYVVTINGGNTMTLSGNNASRLFTVNKGAALTLNNITITKGFRSGDGGAIRNDGTLNLNSAKFLDNHATNGSGGAILSHSALNIQDSEFSNNTATNGGALYLKWGGSESQILNTKFHDNQTLSPDTGWGGAVLVFDGAFAVIGTSTFTKNKAGYGGALYNYYGTLQLHESTLSSNSGLGATGGGGAIFSQADPSVTPTNLLLDKTFVTGNSAKGHGGGIHNELGKVWLMDTTLGGNSTIGAGGGIYSHNGILKLDRTTLNGNTAIELGGGIHNDGSGVELTNVTVSGNSAGEVGGLYNYNAIVTITNATISGNAGAETGGIFNSRVTITLKNTLLAKGAQGINCAADATVSTLSFNLSNDNSCGLGAGRDNVTLLLGALANNGGFTKTHLLSTNPKSPAIDNGTGSGCPTTDQRGVTRPQGLACDVGAVEMPPITPTPTRTATRTATRPANTPTRTSTTIACQSKPAKPTLKKPADNASLALARPKLKWNNASCALTYQVVVKNATTGATIDKQSGLTTLQYKTDPLPGQTTYKWFVKACNPPFGCAKSAPRRLIIQ